MGAELERKREGKKTKTDMSESELEKMASKPDSQEEGLGRHRSRRPARSSSTNSATRRARVSGRFALSSHRA